MALLEIEDLVVDYGKIRALKGVSMRVEAGELVAVIGSNGAGKTTTVRTVSGLLRPTSGDVRLEGRSLTRLAPNRIAALGVVQVPEGRKVFARLSVATNLELGAYLRLARGERRPVEEDVAALYRTFPRLSERRDQLAGTLSGGEQQMLAIARALVAKPRLLVLDEPSMGLAPVVIDEVFSLVERLRRSREVTILLVEQLAYRALEVADRAYVMERGKIRFTGTGAELLSDERVRRAYLGAVAS